MTVTARAPLHGVKVIELAGLAPAPFGAMVLADLGAEVLRIDRATPGAGFIAPAGPLDRGKHCMALDLKASRDRDFVLELAGSADVFIEGFRPGVAERLGLGPQQLMTRNPELVYGRMTGWGQTGPLASTAGHDINYIAVSGVLGLLGRADEPPVPPANIIGDFAGGGMLLALGIIAALYERHQSGRGQIIDAAMVDGAALYTAFLHGMRAAGRWSAPRGRNEIDGGAPYYDTYECADGRYVAVGCIEPAFYQQMLSVLGIDVESMPPQDDQARWPEAKTILAATFKQRVRDEWTAVFEGSDACVVPLLSPWEAAEHPHSRAREAFIDIDGIVQPAPAPRFSRTSLPTPNPLARDPESVRTLVQRWTDTGR